MANTYNPYSDVKGIYDLKVQWDEANKLGDKNKTNAIAANAQVYYDNLINNNYGGVANALKSVGSVDAKSILDKYSPTTVENNNLKSGEINRENAGLFEKYNQTYEDLTKTNPFKTDEGKAILGKYDLAGLQARDNAVASGGASNGGNIDSYSSANALRQQASLISQGQSAVLEAHQQKIDNVRGLLSDMGVNIDRVFNQDETAKNNDVARKSEVASVTGVVPTEWTYDSNIYLNSDGTVKEEFMTTEFDNTGGFTTIINNAKSKLATTTDATERANLIATINAATQAKALKTFSSPKYSKYAHEVTGTASTPTEEHRQFDVNSEIARESLTAEKEINDANNKNALDQINATSSGNIAAIKAETQGQKEIIETQTGLPTTSYVIDEQYVPLIKTVMNKINSEIANHKNGKGVTDAMKYEGDGVFSFTSPQFKPSAWKYTICNAIIDAGVPQSQVGALLYQLGLTDNDLAEVQAKRNNQ